jgi:hypothetical protein
MTDATLNIQSDFMHAHAVLSTAWRPGLKSAALRARRQLYRTWGSVGFATAPWYCDHGRRGGFPIGWSQPPPSCVGCASNLPVVGKAVIAPCPHGAAPPRNLLGKSGRSDKSDLVSCQAPATRSRSQATVPCNQPAAIYGVEVSRESKAIISRPLGYNAPSVAGLPDQRCRTPKSHPPNSRHASNEYNTFLGQALACHRPFWQRTRSKRPVYEAGRQERSSSSPRKPDHTPSSCREICHTGWCTKSPGL